MVYRADARQGSFPVVCRQALSGANFTSPPSRKEVHLKAMGMENIYGCCPVCGMNDGYLSVGEEEQWFYCLEHKKKWLFSFGYFSATHRTAKEGIRAEEFLADFEPVPMRMGHS